MSLFCIVVIVKHKSKVSSLALGPSSIISTRKKLLTLFDHGDMFQIVEQCFICLLNGGEWKQLAELAATTRGTGQAEAAVATALAAYHLRTKPTKKLPEDLWDMGLWNIQHNNVKNLFIFKF